MGRQSQRWAEAPTYYLVNFPRKRHKNRQLDRLGGGGVHNFYRPQRSCGKVMFLHLSVILFPSGQTPPMTETP